jgi:hypothetical protein
LNEEPKLIVTQCPEQVGRWVAFVPGKFDGRRTWGDTPNEAVWIFKEFHRPNLHPVAPMVPATGPIPAPDWAEGEESGG